MNKKREYELTRREVRKFIETYNKKENSLRSRPNENNSLYIEAVELIGIAENLRDELRSKNSEIEYLKKKLEENEEPTKNPSEDPNSFEYHIKREEYDVISNGGYEPQTKVSYTLTNKGNLYRAIIFLPAGRTLILPEGREATKVLPEAYIYKDGDYKTMIRIG